MPSFIFKNNVIEHLSIPIELEPDINLSLTQDPTLDYKDIIYGPTVDPVLTPDYQKYNEGKTKSPPIFTPYGCNIENKNITIRGKKYLNGYTISLDIYCLPNMLEKTFLIQQNLPTNSNKTISVDWSLAITKEGRLQIDLNSNSLVSTNSIILNKWNSIIIVFDEITTGTTTTTNLFLQTYTIYLNGIPKSSIDSDRGFLGNVFYRDNDRLPYYIIGNNEQNTPAPNMYVKNFRLMPKKLSENLVKDLIELIKSSSSSITPPNTSYDKLNPNFNLSLTTDPTLTDNTITFIKSDKNSKIIPTFSSSDCILNDCGIAIPALNFDNQYYGYAISLDVYPIDSNFSSGTLFGQGPLDNIGYNININNDGFIQITMDAYWDRAAKNPKNIEKITTNKLILNQWNSIIITVVINMKNIIRFNIYINGLPTEIPMVDAYTDSPNLPGYYKLGYNGKDSSVSNAKIKNFMIFRKIFNIFDVDNIIQNKSSIIPGKISDAQNKFLNLLVQYNNAKSDDVLSQLSTITRNQNVSVVVNASPDIAKFFNNNSATYPKLVGSPLPVTLATTASDSATGHQKLDLSQIIDNSILVVPSLTTGSTIIIINNDTTIITIKRGTGTQSNQLFINGGTMGIILGDPITIGNKTFLLSGIGSPVIFSVSRNNTPVTLLDYLFMYSYVLAFSGAIFYSVMSIISIDIANIFINKNVSVAFNVYLGIVGIISLSVWLNVKLPFNLFNQGVVVTS